MANASRRCCWNCDWWSDGGDTSGACNWVVLEGLPFWAQAAEPAVKPGVDGYYTHFDAGADCAAHKPREG